MTISPETIVGGLTLLGGVVIVMNRVGLVTFGRKECKDIFKDCPIGIQLEEKFDKLARDYEKLDAKVDEIVEGVAFIRGKMNGGQ